MTPRARRGAFYLLMAFLFLAIALTGFSTTFFIPLARGTFEAPAIIHLHGALSFAWLLLFILQAWLIQRRRILTHRRFGWIAFAVGVGIVISGVVVGVQVTRRDLAAGGGDFALGQFVNILIEMAVFGLLVGAAIVYRRDGESHKRLLLLATISALAPAWLRLRHLLPTVPHPFVTFSALADSLLLLAVARDWLTIRRIHPVYLWVGSAVLVIHVIELLAMRSAAWLWLAQWLLGNPVPPAA